MSDLIDTIDAIYSASTDAARWPEALERLRVHVDALGVTLVYVDELRATGSVVASAGIDPQAVAEYPEWAVQDVSARAGLAQPVGTIIDSARLMPESEYERTPFYDGFLRRWGLFHVAGSKLIQEPWGMASVGLHRPRDRRFDGPSLDRYRRVSHHICRALDVHHRLSRADSLERGLAELLEAVPTATVLLDHHGRIVAANRSALKMVADMDGLALTRQGICSLARSGNDDLRRALRRALRPDQGEAPPEVVRFPRPSGRRPYQLVLAPIATDDALSEGLPKEAVVTVFVTDPERSIDICEATLQQVADLTPAESRVAALLAQGEGTAAIASRLGIGADTVRTHLKRIYSKTGVSSQPQLVAHLHRLLPPTALR